VLPTPFDILLILIFFAAVAIVLNSALNSLDQQFRVKVGTAEMAQQLSEVGLDAIIGIACKFKGRYAFDALKEIGLEIENKSTNYIVYVDWDHSALTDFGGRSRRVVRKPPDMMPDLWQFQPFSAVDIGKTLEESITAEDVLKLDPESGRYKISQAVADVAGLGTGNKKQKALYKSFDMGKVKLEFSLRLAVRAIEPRQNLMINRAYIRCPFTLEKLPWTAQLPWNQKPK